MVKFLQDNDICVLLSCKPVLENIKRQPAYIVGKDPYTLFPLPATVLNSSPWSGLRRGFALASRQSQHGRSVPLPSIVGSKTIMSSFLARRSARFRAQVTTEEEVWLPCPESFAPEGAPRWPVEHHLTLESPLSVESSMMPLVNAEWGWNWEQPSQSRVVNKNRVP